MARRIGSPNTSAACHNGFYLSALDVVQICDGVACLFMDIVYPADHAQVQYIIFGEPNAVLPERSGDAEVERKAVG